MRDRCGYCERRRWPGQRTGKPWNRPGLHAACALADMDHPLERGFNWKRPTGWEDDKEPEAWAKNAPITWWGWGYLYLHWWQYSPPWSCTRGWWFRYMNACDGVRASRLIQLPLLGHVVYFRNAPCGHHDDNAQEN